MTESRWLSAARQIDGELRSLFRRLHECAEPSRHEWQTTELVVERLSGLGLQVRTFEDYPGAVGFLPGPSGGPVVALRCDMDGLPEATRSLAGAAHEGPSAVHACGHDMHMTACLGAARLLSAEKGDLPFGVKFLFQPAEEVSEGARALLARGVLDQPPVDFIAGIHAMPELPVGQVGLVSGPVLASESNFSVVVTGAASHAAEPHKGRDAIVAAATVVLALQSLVSRRVDPAQPAVLTIGRAVGGTASNVLAASMTLYGTLRCFDPEVLSTLRSQVIDTAAHVAASSGCSAEVQFEESIPPVVNDPAIVERIRGGLESALGAGRVVEWPASMASEDFGCYLERVPGVFMWVGTTGACHEAHPLHSSLFEVDLRALPWVVAVLCAIADHVGRDVSSLKRPVGGNAGRCST